MRVSLLVAALLAGLMGCDSATVVGGGADGGMDAAVDVLRCGPGQAACEGACASVQTDPANCGACGRRCASGERCTAGLCATSCPGDQVACASDGGARCVSTAVDLANCGACGRACAAGEVCAAGACATSCAAQLLTCTNDQGQRVCADPQRDPLNCGACGRACAPGQACVSAQCVANCAVGFTACAAPLDAGAAVCVDLRADRANCGACGAACGAGEVCANGACQVSCGGGTTNCNGVCRDLQTDNAHCGMCGSACPAGQVCTLGTCAVRCAAGFDNCEGVCRDLQTDRAHCGACDSACPAGRVCNAGRCEVSCSTGLTRCGDACVSVTSDPAHCGACDNACPARANSAAVCATGRCGILCDDGFVDCNNDRADGCELRVGGMCTVGLGVCARPGVTACVSGAAQCVGAAGMASAETCNNLDDDCDGMTDEMLTRACYTGPTGTSGVGACRAGMQGCAAGAFGSCQGQVLPVTETCNNVDDDCNGSVDNGITRACYTGPTGTAGVGPCRAGTQTCSAGSFGTSCAGEVLPVAEVCFNSVDDDCDGMADEGCGGNGSSCQAATVVTATTSFNRNTCMNAGDSGSDTSCGTTGSPEHVYVVQLTRSARVTVQVSGFPSGGGEGDILYRGTSCPGTAVACTQHNTDLAQNLSPGSHYFFIEDDHAACQAYTVTFNIF